jgi:hypothetical protein
MKIAITLLQIGDVDANRGPEQARTQNEKLRKFRGSQYWEQVSMLFEKLVKENKIDRVELLKKLKLDNPSNNMLEEGESQFNDILLDEQILDDESIEDEQIASEAKHQNSIGNNQYKFRNKEHGKSERPKTSHSIHRLNNNGSIGDDRLLGDPSDTKAAKQNSSIEEK